MPLHPLIVHFPIALLILGTLIELASLKYREQLNMTGTVLLISGVITGVISYMTGDSAERFAEMHFGNIEAVVHQHKQMALGAMFLFGAAAALKLLTHFTLRYRKELLIVVLILSILGSGFLAYTGHLGGQIVYQNNKITNIQGE
ncbi:hypothetical protein ERX37_08310 [Macrococcus hajekii]|uniref:DUF2231 domain-containing protein n=1 Tax=Macrococcus hajekii TaxID=198482 RepID=A0A4R6BJ17_9STAP|nr:DUF2231 domain-containing protein [Macrococcus hajekii]TDM01491.1 hypothetical protein ERX37_08310 [Macrococcus hajekii]GGB00385.1 hypothetical protein GCM10007190_05600 [Macrococcus hajekii]